MQTFIVPTDFSDTAKNAAIYAAGLSAQVAGSRILLYHVFDKIDTESSDGSVVYNDHAARKSLADLALQHVRAEMKAAAPLADISCLAEEKSAFLHSLEKLAAREAASLIIMGITGTTPLEQAIVGSNTLDMVNRNICPVMIIPPNALFTGVRNLVLATDFKAVKDTIPANTLQAMLKLFRPFVHVVHVDKEHAEASEQYALEKAQMDSLLAGYASGYYFIRQDNFVEAINQFVADHQIDMIIIIPKKHSFFSSLFAASHTKKLAYHSHVPLLAIHE